MHRSGRMSTKPRHAQGQGHGPVAVCVLRLERQEEALLISLSINPDIRLRTTSRSFRTLDLEWAINAVRETAEQLMAAKPLAISPAVSGSIALHTFSTITSEAVPVYVKTGIPNAQSPGRPTRRRTRDASR